MYNVSFFAIGLYNFYEKSNIHRFVQKPHEFHVMVNMNNICIYSIFKYLNSWNIFFE